MSADPAPKSTMTPMTADFHEAANLFPLMEEAALAELAADIKANGLRDPIWRHPDGRIIDGRNRWLACQMVGVECRHRTYDRGDETIVPFVVSHNLHRRHLTTAQRAAVAADIATCGRARAQTFPQLRESPRRRRRKLLNVSVASVERAAAVKRADPVLHEKVKAGELTAGKARATIAKALEPPIAEVATEVEANADEDPDADPSPSDGDHALAAIMAVAELKISGTAAATNYAWTDAELKMAEKAATWLKMFTRVAKRERKSAAALIPRASGNECSCRAPHPPDPNRWLADGLAGCSCPNAQGPSAARATIASASSCSTTAVSAGAASAVDGLATFCRRPLCGCDERPAVRRHRSLGGVGGHSRTLAGRVEGPRGRKIRTQTGKSQLAAGITVDQSRAGAHPHSASNHGTWRCGPDRPRPAAAWLVEPVRRAAEAGRAGRGIRRAGYPAMSGDLVADNNRFNYDAFESAAAVQARNISERIRRRASVAETATHKPTSVNYIKSVTLNATRHWLRQWPALPEVQRQGGSLVRPRRQWPGRRDPGADLHHRLRQHRHRLVSLS